MEVPTVVVDHDGTSLSRRMARMADAGPFVQVTARTTNRLEAEGLVAGARTLSAGIEIQRLEAGGMTPDQAGGARAPVLSADRPLYNPAEGYASYIVPGVLVLILQQTLLIGIGLLAGTAREDGQRPASEGSFASTTGRILAYFVIYFTHAVFYFVAVFRIFNLPYRGDLGATLAFTVPFLLSAISLAIIISNLFRYRETALQVLLFTSLPAIFLSGFAWPTEMVPRWLSTLALLLPSTAGTEGFLRINQMGATLAQVKTEWRILWVLAGAYFLLAWWIHTWRMNKYRTSAL